MFKAAVKGALITLSSTVVACLGAVYIERAAHRTLYGFFPHWYQGVDYAIGLEPYLLQAVRVTNAETNEVSRKQDALGRYNGEWLSYSDNCTQARQIFAAAMTS
jgi:hypothetical protein